MLSTMAQDRYFDFTYKVKIERLKEKLLNAGKSACFDNEAASMS